MQEVLKRAGRMQADARPSDGRTVDDVKEVAKDLDIDPKLVDAALAELKAERARAAEAAAASAAVRKRLIRRALIGLAVAAALAFIWGLSASGSIKKAATEAAEARGRLESVLRRQATLVPQLAALSGADAASLEPLQRQVESAKDLATLRSATAELQRGVVHKLSSMPDRGDAAASQQRLSLQAEITGSQNRVSVEDQRYQQAVARWRAASGGLGGSIATTFGLAPSPPSD